MKYAKNSGGQAMAPSSAVPIGSSGRQRAITGRVPNASISRLPNRNVMIAPSGMPRNNRPSVASSTPSICWICGMRG